MRVSLHIIRVERQCESVGVLLFLCEQCVENVGTAKQETQSQEGQMKRACKHGIYTLFTIYRFQLTMADMVKRTYQPKKRKRTRTHGFMKRAGTRTGRALLTRRRRKGRTRLST